MKSKKEHFLVGIICNNVESYGGVQVCVWELIKGLNEVGVIPDIISDVEPNKQIYSKNDLDYNYVYQKYGVGKEAMTRYKKFLMPFREYLYYYKTSWLSKKYDFVYFFQHNIIVNSKVTHLCYLSNSPITDEVAKTTMGTIKEFLYRYIIKYIHPIFEYQRYNCVINSQYTAKIFSRMYGKQLKVVYPPCQLGYNMEEGQVEKDSKLVIVYSRISRAKRTHKVIELAQLWTDYSFVVVGGISDSDYTYLEMMKKKVLHLNLKNIEFMCNLSYENLQEVLKMGSFYLFFAINEHFGISTVEACNFGCLPLVHNSGGQREIIPVPELRFDDSELQVKFRDLVSMDDERKEHLLVLLRKHMLKFSAEIYKREMTGALNLLTK